ncbi:hypothetical protein D3C87_1641520 [compost metagenome]
MRQQSNDAAFTDGDLTLVGTFLPIQQMEKRCFAGAVAADQADFFTLADIEGNVAQHELGTVVFLNILA